jgi:anti-sigma-K factor RskA
MMADHEHLEELIAADTLGGLDVGERRELERQRAAHGADCVECRRLEDEYGEVAGRLAFAVDPIPLREGFEDEVVAATTDPRPALERVVDLRSRRRDTPRPRSTGFLRPLAAVAAAIVLFVGGWAVGVGTSGSDPGSIPSDARVVAFQGNGHGTLALAYRPGEKGVYLLGSGLEAPPSGDVYEVWMIRDKTPVSGACVRPSPDGSLFAFTDAALGTTETMAVTVESSSCPSAPTSEPVFTASIRA